MRERRLRTPMDKLPHDMDAMIALIAAAVRPYPKAALFELYEDGYTTAFEQLVACIISIRTYDEVTLPTARNLFRRARTPAEMSMLPASEIDALIRASSFHARKAAQILALAQRVENEFGGVLPCDAQTILSFAGVGVKCAHLVLGIACDIKRVSADIHVHRVTNRWGYIATLTPDATVLALEARLPEKYWVEINRLLVPFGKHICNGRLPRCSTCPVLTYCQQVNVTVHR